MRAITYARPGFVNGCNASILGVSRLNAPGHPSTEIALVPIGNNKSFDIYVNLVDGYTRRVATNLDLGDAITFMLRRVDHDELPEV